jgi:hypothetical protein
LNQHGHEWEMRIDRHAQERKEELTMFCELISVDRAENDESAEYNRVKDLESNPNSAAFGTAAQDLARVTGGGDFDRF